MWEVFRDALVEVLSSLLSGLTGVGVGIIELFFQKKQILENEKRHQEILSNKIEKLTASLHESSQLMTEIEAEFEKQKQLAEKWQKQAATSQLIASLNEEEVEAISQIFGRQLEKESRKSGRASWWWSFIFCILGIAGGYIVGKYLL